MSDFPFKVSVVIPSYNRAHLLKYTLPSYLQEDVGELILVDDCSLDNTAQVISDLQKHYLQIKYIRNDNNSGQTFSKNRGIEKACGEFIYFGDDDSILLQGSIALLLDAVQECAADIAGARALYMGNYCSFDDFSIAVFERWQRDKVCVSSEEVTSIVPFESHFNAWVVDRRADAKYLPACMLCRQAGAKQILFDTKYTGCAYREETDFCIRSFFAGMKLVYEPRAVQINLPSKIVGTTGAHKEGKKKWLESALECNRYFFDKNWENLISHFGISISKETMILQTEEDIRRIAMQKTNPIKEILKKIYFKMIIIPQYAQKVGL